MRYSLLLFENWVFILELKLVFRIKFLILLFCLGIHFSSKAQSPGYMGKKTVVGYGFCFNPAFTAFLVGYGDSPLNTQHDFFIERTVAKKVALGFSIKAYRSSYNNTSEMDLEGMPLPSNYSYGYGFKAPEGAYEIKARAYTFYAKFFKRDYVSPWGKYFLVGFTHHRYNCSYSPDQMYLELTDYDFTNNTTKTIRFNDFGPITQLHKYTDIVIGNGNSRIFANNLVIDYGYSINLLAMTLTVLDAPDDDGQATYLDYIKVTSARRVRGINRFNFFVKVGYLF